MLPRQIYWTDNDELCSNRKCLITIPSSSCAYVRIASASNTDFVILQVDKDGDVEDDVVLVSRWVVDLLSITVGSFIEVELIDEGNKLH